MDVGDDPEKVNKIDAWIEKDRKLTVEEVKAEQEYVCSFDRDPEMPEGMVFKQKTKKIKRAFGLEEEGENEDRPAPEDQPE